MTFFEQDCDYGTLFNGLMNNMVAVQKIRKELGLPPEIFKGLDFTKEMQKTLKNYQLASKLVIMEQPQNQEIEVNAQATTMTYPTTNKEKIPTKPKNDQKTSQEPQQINILTTQKEEFVPFPKTTNDTFEKSTEEESYIFDSNYFNLIHQYHQKQKSQSTTGIPSNKQKLLDYEMGLYSYLMNNIFHPKQRPTWSNLVSSLTGFGFKGKPNTLGNGSTWEFSVTDKNELFFMNPDYKGATFNVHEFKGNEPIHPRYLKFFQSGFSNVFGLTEEYVVKELGL